VVHNLLRNLLGFADDGNLLKFLGSLTVIVGFIFLLFALADYRAAFTS